MVMENSIPGSEREVYAHRPLTAQTCPAPALCGPVISLHTGPPYWAFLSRMLKAECTKSPSNPLSPYFAHHCDSSEPGRAAQRSCKQEGGPTTAGFQNRLSVRAAEERLVTRPLQKSQGCWSLSVGWEPAEHWKQRGSARCLRGCRQK